MGIRVGVTVGVRVSRVRVSRVRVRRRVSRPYLVLDGAEVHRHTDGDARGHVLVEVPLALV